MSHITNQNTEPLFIFDMPDDEVLSQTISVKGEKGERGDPTKLSELENDTGFITASTSSLANYYTKTATDSALAAKLDKSTFDAYEIPSDFFTGDDTTSDTGASITLSNTSESYFKSITFGGDTSQTGTPTPDAPVDIDTVTGLQTITITGDDTQTYSIDLGDIELCKLGDHQDYIHKVGGKWFKHKEVNTLTLTGTEPNWYMSARAIKIKWTDLNVDDIARTYTYSGATSVAFLTILEQTYYSTFQPASSTGYGFALRTEKNDGDLTDSANAFYLYYPETMTTVADVKSVLAETTPTLYYAMQTAVEEEITDSALLSQLQAIEKAKSYNGSTALASSGSLAAILSVEAFTSTWSGTIDGVNSALDFKADKPDLDKRPYYFDSVADMKRESLADGNYAITSGYYSYGDGGGAEYRIVDDISLTDDGATVHALDNGLKAVLIVKGNTISIKQFGAKGDGTTDDTSAIQKALAWNGNKKSIINFEESATYAVTGANYPLYSNTQINLNGSTIVNTGSSRILLVSNEDSMEVAGYGAIKNVTVKDGTFTGNRSSAQSGLMFALMHAQNFEFSNIRFDKCATGHIFDLSGCKDIRILNCEFEGNLITDPSISYRETIQISSATEAGFPYWGTGDSYQFDNLPSDGVLIDGCKFIHNSADTYYLTPIGNHANDAAPNNDITIKNCYIDGYQNYGIRLPQVTNLRIENNTIKDVGAQSGASAILLIPASRSGSYVGSNNITIIGNKYTAQAGSSNVYTFALIDGFSDANPTENVRIEGNTIIGNSVSEAAFTGGDCFHLGAVKNVIISGNNIQNVKHVIYKHQDYTSQNVRLCNNQIKDALRFIRTGDSMSSTTATMSGFSSDNNVFSNSNGTINTSSFVAHCGFSEDVSLSSGDTRPPLNVLSENMFIAVTNDQGGNSNIRIPPYIKRFRFNGYLTIENAQNITAITMTIRDFAASTNLVSKTFKPVVLQSGTSTIVLPALKNEDISAYENLSSTDGRIGKIGVYFYITASGSATIKSATSQVTIEGY